MEVSLRCPVEFFLGVLLAGIHYFSRVEVFLRNVSFVVEVLRMQLGRARWRQPWTGILQWFPPVGPMLHVHLRHFRHRRDFIFGRWFLFDLPTVAPLRFKLGVKVQKSIVLWLLGLLNNLVNHWVVINAGVRASPVWNIAVLLLLY